MSDRLSLCMIVKNEAASLGKCLASVQDVVGEMIVLDTGSTDRTVEIAEEFGAQVHHYKWQQDFAAARNHALKFVTKEWVLVLDADETLNPEVILPLETAIADPETLVINLLRQEIGATQSPYSLVSRLFRRHPDVYFERPYHALIDDSVTAVMQHEPHWKIKELPEIAILHTGYGVEAIATLDKTTRAKAAMESYFATHPHDPYVCSKLGAIYLSEGSKNKGFKILKQGLKCSSQASPTLLYELHYHLGNAYRQQRNPDKAMEHYQKALSQPLLDKLKIGAQHNLGALLQTLGRADLAIAQHQRTVASDPDFAAGYYHLGMAFKALGYLPQAIAAYQKAIELVPDDPWNYQNLGALLFRLGQIDQSIEQFKRAIALHDQQNPEEAQRLRQKLASLMNESF